MKKVEAYIHHVRTAAVVEALADAGFGNLVLHDVKGMLRPITENERDYSVEAGGLVISEVRLVLVVEDEHVEEVTAIIRKLGCVGLLSCICGNVYVTPVEQALPIGGP